MPEQERMVRFQNMLNLVIKENMYEVIRVFLTGLQLSKKMLVKVILKHMKQKV